MCGSKESLGQKSQVVVVESLVCGSVKSLGQKTAGNPKCSHSQVRPAGHAAHDDDDNYDVDYDDDGDDNDDDDGYNEKNLNRKTENLAGTVKLLVTLRHTSYLSPAPHAVQVSKFPD